MLGARIRSARESLGMKAHELAGLAGLDPTALSKIENGHRGVKSAELARIAGALGMSPLGLLDSDSLMASLPIAARDAGPTMAQGSAYQRILALAELHTVLADGGLPGPTVSEADWPDVAGLGWLQAADTLATWARKRLDFDDCVGPDRFSSLVAAIERSLGCDVLVETYDDDGLSGAAVGNKSFPLVFVNSRYPASRCLFTLAHELGHLLAGHGDAITLDRDLRATTDSERVANAFAASFLMPQSRIQATIDEHPRNTPAALIKLVSDLAVSFESLVFRLHNLQIINAEGRDRLRDIGWEGLRATLDREEAVALLGVDGAARLRSRGSARPAEHPPIFLTQRAMDGYRKGVISIRPLTGLLNESAEALEATLDRHDDVYELLSSPEYSQVDEATSTEDLFAGSPV